MRRKTLVKSVIAIIAIPYLLYLLLLFCLQSRMIYFPRAYEDSTVKRFTDSPGAKVVDYTTSDGHQQAYLYSATSQPERLWIVCGGNGSVALDWFDWIRTYAPKQDAWLLFDMPGYGASTGSPTPASILRSLKAAVPAAEVALDWKPEDAAGRLRFFGHSLGAAVGLIAADEFDIHRGVLLTPFTSTMDMAKVVTNMPIGFIVWQRFDNEARLKKLATAADAKVFIFHGSDDEAIPVEMSRRMAAEFPALIDYHEVPQGRHNTLQGIVEHEIAAALEEARR